MSQSRSTTRIRISLDSGEGSTRSPIGLIGAIAIHVAIIGATLFTWEHRLDIAQEAAPIVPVDLVTIAQKTNIAPTVRPEPKMEQIPVPQAAPPDLVAQTPPLPHAEPAPPPDVKPQPAPKPQPEKDKLADILNNLTSPATQPVKKPTKDKLTDILNNLTTPQQSGRTAPQTHAPAGPQTAMTTDLVNALRSEIYRCWSPPDYAPNAADLVVSYDLLLNLDGSVARPPQLDARSQAEVNRGNSYVTAADFAARKAIHACAPYKLPADRYSQWREINPFKFDPRDMTGQ